jgi:Sec-independent protein translocase protein TatA
VGFGTEILFMLMLGLLVLGPKRLQTMLAHIARAKARFEDASHGFRSQLAAELDAEVAPGSFNRCTPRIRPPQASHNIAACAPSQMTPPNPPSSWDREPDQENNLD